MVGCSDTMKSKNLIDIDESDFLLVSDKDQIKSPIP